MRKTTGIQATRAMFERAAKRQHPVTISYTTASGRDVVRTVEPYGIQVSAAGDVLVKTMDRESGEYRSFRLDRVGAYTVHRTAFKIKNPTHHTEVVMAVDHGAPADEPEQPVQTVVAQYTSRKIWNRTAVRYSDDTLAVFYGCSRVETYRVGGYASADIWILVNGLEPVEERVSLERESVRWTIRQAGTQLDGCDVDAAALHLSTLPVDEVTPAYVWRIARLYTPEKEESVAEIKEMPEYRTSNGVVIRPGLRVLDYDRKKGSVGYVQFTRGGSCDPGGEYFDGWFEIVRDDGSTSQMNGERLRAL